MFDAENYMSGMDRLYEERRIDEIEPYLLHGLELAGEQKEAVLVILNDLMGYYRAVSRHEDMIACSKRVEQLIAELHLENTVNHGTSLLNIATGFRAAGRYDEAERYYCRARDILSAHLAKPDYRMATLHNNLGLLYTATGRLKEAKQSILAALELTRQLPDMEIETAITCTNLGNVCFGLNEIRQAGEYMEQAVRLFEQEQERPDPHYPAALAGMGQANFHAGKLEKAAEYYQKSLDTLEKMYGRNDDWQTTLENLETVRDLIRRRDAMQAQGMKGLELARSYYEEAGRPMIEEKYPEYAGRIAAGLAGEGSECLGFDDGYSTDHDFGPGFCLWLNDEDYAAIGAQLQADYNALPAEWRGMPVRNTTREGAGRVGVMKISDFFRKFTGYAEAPQADAPKGIAAWLQIPPELLCTAVNGAVFRDDAGEFTRRRAAFAEYPGAVRLYRLADALHKAAQAGQYNYTRGRKRADMGMMYSSLAEFISAAAETGYLLNRRYMPFYKWRIRGMEDFKQVPQLKTMLEQLMAKPADDGENERKIEEICRYLARELRAQGLTDTDADFLDEQQAAVLRRMQAAAQMKGDAAVNTVQELAEKIVKTEWDQFQKVQNEGGRADCQNNWPTFRIMRTSQFLTWDVPVLESYLGDLEEGNELGWNLVTEKYARMMEHTSPERYREFADKMPPLSAQRVQLQEALIGIMMRWTSEVYEQYPDLAQRGRYQFTAEDTEGDTSSETYLRGEMSTYSDATLKLYGGMVLGAVKADRNLVRETLAHTAELYGYESLEQADAACKAQNGTEK